MIGSVHTLTLKQRAVLDFIRRFHAERGCAPNLGEICKAMNNRAVATAYNYVITLQAKGYLRKGASGRIEWVSGMCPHCGGTGFLPDGKEPAAEAPPEIARPKPAKAPKPSGATIQLQRLKPLLREIFLSLKASPDGLSEIELTKRLTAHQGYGKEFHVDGLTLPPVLNHYARVFEWFARDEASGKWFLVAQVADGAAVEAKA